MSKCEPLFVVTPVKLTPAEVISTNAVAESLPAYSSGAQYVTGERVIYDNAVWEAARDGSNLAAPERNSDDWLYVYATNPYRCIDDKIETQTQVQDQLVMEVKANDFVSVVALLNVSATSVKIEVVDDVDGVVYEKEDRMGDYGVNDLWQWLYKPFRLRTEISFNDLPPYRNVKIRITLTAAQGDTVKLGHIVMGMPFYVGMPRAGLAVGIADYSRMQRDDFGNLTLMRRSFSNFASVSLIVDTSRVDEVRRTLAGLRSTLTYWHGVSELESTFIFGFYRDFEITVQSMQVSDCRLHIEGVI